MALAAAPDTTAMQPSLWSLDAADAGTTFQPLAPERTELSAGAWIEVQRSWMRGGFALFDQLLQSPNWKAERRRMYDSVVDVPRLLQFLHTDQHIPWPELLEARNNLSTYYRPTLGEDFTSTGLCLYRSGADSVAWHGDTIGRGATHDTLVAILSFGAARTLALRPKGGGASLRINLDHGDLIVMGGSCQRTWDHAIPKTSRVVGPRVSAQFRPRGVA